MLFTETPVRAVCFGAPGKEAANAAVRYESGRVTVEAAEPVIGAELVWELDLPEDALILGDEWERAYATLGWRKKQEYGAIPWYFLAFDGSETLGLGVAVRPNAMCFWTLGAHTVTLHLDLRCGPDPVEPGGRIIEACTVITARISGKPFYAARAFCAELCTDPVMPAEPVYGGNDWYCNYGDNSYSRIMTHARRIAECAPAGKIRPYMVVDDGWQLCRGGADGGFIGGPWLANRKFGGTDAMKRLAADISALDVKPGIWIRPLLTAEYVGDVFMNNAAGRFLDPSCEGALDYVREQVARIEGWGYKLLKHDYSTYDITCQWGPALGGDMLRDSGHMRDRSRTTAEIIKSLYYAIREAAGSMEIIGCNVIGHLSAGIFGTQRTGDDTSGKVWERTVAMGVNTLAYRLPQHGTFFAADADCVGITRLVRWEDTEKWLKLLAVSGTPLFASIADDAYDTKVKEALTAAFAEAVKAPAGTTAEPIDWTDSFAYSRKVDYADYDYMCMAPARWLGTDGNLHTFEWFE